MQSTGTKFWDTVAYGKLTGSFTWSFTLDYDYLEPFYLAFEESVLPVDPTDDNDRHAGSMYRHTGGYYTFAKQDGARPRSFVIRAKMINHTTNDNADSDEMRDLYGCVIRNIKVSKSSSSSQVNVTFTGFYASEKMVEGNLPYTDYQAYHGQLAEYMCMFTADNTPTSSSDYEYVANTDSLDLSIANNTDAIFTTCSPFAKNFFEGTASFDFSTSCWSNDIHRYKTRVYGGGMETTKVVGNQYYPMTKQLKPLSGIRLYTYDGTLDDMDGSNVASIIENSDHVAVFNIRDTVIKSLPWPKGDGSKIQDVISSAECRNIWLEVKVPSDGGTYPIFDPQNPGVRNGLTDLTDISELTVSVTMVNGVEGESSIAVAVGEVSASSPFLVPYGTTYSVSGSTMTFTNGSTTVATVTVTPGEHRTVGADAWTYSAVTEESNTSGASASPTISSVPISSTITMTNNAEITVTLSNVS